MTHLRHGALAALLAGVLAAVPGARATSGQVAATPAQLTVTVRDAGTDAAIANATVKVAPTWYGTKASGQVDPQGRVVFDGLSPSDYTVSVSAPGYDLRAMPVRSDSLFHDIPTPDRRKVTLVAGGLTQIDFRLHRGGRLATTVTAASGAPAEGVAIELLPEFRMPDGRAGPFPGPMPPARVTTGADGRAIIDSLPPGRFYVRAVLPGTLGHTENYVYAPGVTAAAEAVPIDIRQSEDVLASLTLPAPGTIEVSGRTVTAAGVAVAGAEIFLVSIDGAGAASVTPLVRTDKAGGFVLRGVGPGTYSLQALLRPRDAPVAAAGASLEDVVRARYATAMSLVGSLQIEVGLRPLTGLSVTAVPPALMSGRIIFNGQEVPDPGRTEVLVIPESDAARQRSILAARPEWHPDGRFAVEGRVGLHRLEARLSPGWYLQGVFLEDGTNVTWAPFDFQPGRVYENLRVMVSNETATVVVRVPPALVAPSAVLMVFPEDPGLWGRGQGYVQSVVLTSASGAEHRFTGLVPGLTYLVAAGPLPDDASRLYRSATTPPLAELAKLAPAARRVNVWGPDTFDVTLAGAGR